MYDLTFGQAFVVWFAMTVYLSFGLLCLWVLFDLGRWAFSRKRNPEPEPPLVLVSVSGVRYVNPSDLVQAQVDSELLPKYRSENRLKVEPK